jgi:sugar phosphate isomerase/epimerase
MTDHGVLNRRQFVALGGAAAASVGAASLGPLASPALAAKLLIPRDRIAIQLFTLRRLAEKDLPGTLELLARTGYRRVEVAGLFGRTPQQFRQLLDDNGLRAIGGHQLVGPALEQWAGAREVEDALDEAEALGQRYVGTAGITIPFGIVPGGEPQTADRYRQLAELANSWGAAAAARGMRVYLHMHYWEFWRDLGTGESFARILFRSTDPALVWFEPDLFWMVFGGIDPLPWIRRYQHRFMGFHVKDGNPDPSGGYFDPGFTDLGRGSIDFRRLFEPLEHRRRHYYIVERDNQPHPRKTARIAYRYLRNLRAR